MRPFSFLKNALGGLRRTLVGLGGALFLAIVCLAALPYGGVYQVWLTLLNAGAGLALFVLALAGRARPRFGIVLAALLPGGAALLVLAAQNGAHVQGWLPAGQEVLSRGLGYEEVGQALLFGALLLSGHMLARGGALPYLRVVLYVGGLYAATATLFEVLQPERLLFTEKRAYLGYLTTPFVNRNTAATFYGSFAVALLVVLLRDSAARQARPIRRSADAVALACVVIALAQTGSRAGTLLSAGVAICVGLALPACLANALRQARTPPNGRASRGRTVLARSPGRLQDSLETLSSVFAGRPLSWAAAMLVPLLLAAATLSERFSSDQLSGGGRWETYGATWTMILDRPWLGVGLGGFADVFPSYRVSGLRGTWEHVHSTPLEIAAEGGLPLLAVCFLAVCLIARGCLATLQWSGSRDATCAAMASIGVLMVGTLHALIDFSLEITGYLAVFAGLVGLGTGAPGQASSRGSARF